MTPPAAPWSGGAFDVFVELFEFLRLQRNQPVLRELERDSDRALDLSIRKRGEFKGRLQEVPFLTPAERNSMLKAESASLHESVLNAWATLMGIDLACGELSLSKARWPLPIWAMERLRANRRLNLVSKGAVIPKGCPTPKLDDILLCNLYNITYIPEIKEWPSIDYGPLPQSAQPCVGWRDNWKIGFLSAADEADDLDVSTVNGAGLVGYNVFPSKSGRPRIIARLQRGIKSLAENGAHVILIPECVLDEDIRAAVVVAIGGLEGRLNPIVIAGTQTIGKRGDVCRNQAWLYSDHGRYFCEQDKLFPYDMEDTTAMEWGLETELMIPKGGRAKEFITNRNFVAVRDCPLGRLVVLICQDFSVSGWLRPLLEHLAPTHLFVPVLDAPGPQGWHERAGIAAAKFSAASFVANSRFVLARKRKSKGKISACEFGYFSLPKYEDRKNPSIRWGTIDSNLNDGMHLMELPG